MTAEQFEMVQYFSSSEIFFLLSGELIVYVSLAVRDTVKALDTSYTLYLIASDSFVPSIRKLAFLDLTEAPIRGISVTI